jgi:hypothetical protein
MPPRPYKPRDPVGQGCLVCGRRKGEVPQALLARALPRFTLWLCSACADVAAHRQRLIDEYAEARGLTDEESGPHR